MKRYPELHLRIRDILLIYLPIKNLTQKISCVVRGEKCSHKYEMNLLRIPRFNVKNLLKCQKLMYGKNTSEKIKKD